MFGLYLRSKRSWSASALISLLSGRLIYPLHERLLGRRTFPFWRSLETSQWDSPDGLYRLQAEKLDALLTHARTNVEFYRDRLPHAARDGQAGDPLAALRDVPFLERSDIRENINAMLWQASPGGLFPGCTGGSTGEPVRFFLDRRRQAFDQAARLRAHRWFGVNPGDRELYLWGSPIEKNRTDTLKNWRDALFNQRLLDAFNMSAARLDQYLDAWDAFRPACLFGYPSSIALLVQHAQRRGRELRRKQLRAVFVTGEVCLPQDRKVIADYFGVPVADGYGSRDAGFIAHQCPEGGMHVTAENVVVEIVEEERQVPVGESGEIVTTHLDAYGMPMIRYRTGDRGRLLADRCRCGRGLPLMDVVQGRTTDFLRLPDGNVRHALSIIYPLRETPGIRQFRVVQERDFGVVVEVVCDGRAAQVTRESVSRSLRPVIGADVSLDVRTVDYIEPSPSGKHRYVTSRVVSVPSEPPAPACGQNDPSPSADTIVATSTESLHAR